MKKIFTGDMDGEVITRPATLAERHSETHVELISKSLPHYLNCAYNAGMEIIGEDENFMQVEGTEEQYDHFLNLAHDMSTRD